MSNTPKNGVLIKKQDARGQKFINALWMILFIVAIGILIAAVPGYFLRATNLQIDPVDAPPAYVAAMRIASALASIATASLCIILSAILFWRKRNEIMAIFASFFLLGYGIVMAGPLEALSIFLPEAFLLRVFSIQSALIVTPIMLIFSLFPNGRFVPRWTRFTVLASLIYIPLGFSLTQSDLFSFTNPLTALAGLGYYVFIPLGVYAQVFRYRHDSTLQERQQTKWFVFGLVLWLVINIIVAIPYAILQNLPAGSPLPGWSLLSQFGWFIAQMILPLSLAMAILRYRLWDIDLIISRTLVYGTLTAIVIALYILIVGGISKIFHASDNLFVSLLATGLVAVLFQPLRERLQRAVNRIIYGERDNPILVLTRLGERLETTFVPGAILPTIVESISQALRLPYVGIAVKEGTEFILTAECGQKPASPPACDLFPLNYQGEPIGQILVSRRAGEDFFTPDEKTLLQNIARQVSIAVYAGQLTRDLQRSRERLITAREEERRRLRRDLHDGLGPTLASLTLKLDAARNQLNQNPNAAHSLLVELKSQTQSAIEDIRRLVYNLRPPALDELGLFSAIQEYTNNHLRMGLAVQIECDQEIPKLPAAVEVAAYRIICEALTNVSKHSQATECHVKLKLMFNSALQIDVQDNGLGLPEDIHAGVGMLSMRERAAELGGTFTLHANAGDGVHITAQLPCEVSNDEL